MYFVAKGKCIVVVYDRFDINKEEKKVVKTLRVGDSFGEISMML